MTSATSKPGKSQHNPAKPGSTRQNPDQPGKTGITLEEHHRKMICDAARDFPEIEQVILFGSRALETAGPGSDIDLAITGKDITRSTVLRFHEVLNEQTPLPYFMDVVDYRDIRNDELKSHIDRHGVPVYRRNG